jgi:hypothetical protein
MVLTPMRHESGARIFAVLAQAAQFCKGQPGIVFQRPATFITVFLNSVTSRLYVANSSHLLHDIDLG